jgi:purine nucleosidase
MVFMIFLLCNLIHNKEGIFALANQAAIHGPSNIQAIQLSFFIFGSKNTNESALMVLKSCTFPDIFDNYMIPLSMAITQQGMMLERKSNDQIKRQILVLGFLCITMIPVFGQDPYFQSLDYFSQYDYSTRLAPVIPPAREKIEVIIDTDTKAEVDDLWALSLALLSPERFDIQGIVGATFITGGPESVEMSCREIETILKLAGLEGQIPVYPGGQPMAYPYAPSESEGIDFIIQKAMEHSAEDPLWIIGLGAATDMASALLKKPEIADRIIAFWHLRTAWPEKATNFNVFGDIHAARLLFHSPLKFVLFDTGTHLSCPMEESEKRVGSTGPLGEYLHDYRTGKYGTYGTKQMHERLVRGMTDVDKGFFDLGDIAAMINPEIASFEVVECPDVGHDVTYHFNGSKGKILRCKDIDRDKTFDLFYRALESNRASQ